MDEIDVPSVEGTEEKLWLERYDHPLTNDVVLQTLFEYVSPKDVKTCRLVSKKWSLRILPLARSSFEVIIGSKSFGIPIYATHGVRDFVQLFESNCSGLPFTKFRLGSFSPTVGVGKKYLQLCRDATTHIELNRYDETYLVENVAALLKSSPRLEYLKIPNLLGSISDINGKVLRQDADNDVGVQLFPGSVTPELKWLKTLEVGADHAEQRKRICPTFFEELLGAAENVSTILTSKFSPCHSLGLELLKILEELGRESKIKILSLSHVDAEHLKVLQKMVKKAYGFKLKQLSITQGNVVSPGSWFEILDLFKDSLVSFQVHGNCIFPEHFPKMSALKLLDVKIGNNTLNSDWISKGFCNSFPVLKYLRLSSDTEIKLGECNLGTECCPIMESLNLGRLALNIRSFQHTLEVFPNLKELDMNVKADGADILLKIWTQLTRLEKLNIYGRLGPGNDIESLITGISADGIKRIRRIKWKAINSITMKARRETISALVNEHRIFPSIANLTRLKELTLNITAKNNGGMYRTHLNDLIGYFGFYLMQSLRCLNISDCKLSNTCTEVLITDMGLLSWKFQNPGQLDITPSRWNSDNDFNWDRFPSSKFSFN